MKYDNMPETFKTVLKQMSTTIGVDPNTINFDSPDWMRKHTWSEEKQEDFIEWMVTYLKSNTKARNEILNHPTTNEKLIRKACAEFVFNYGWSLK